MSTRSSLALASDGAVVMHLYEEMHDGEVHLEIALDRTNVRLNLAIPKPLVAGITAIVQRAERDEDCQTGQNHASPPGRTTEIP